MEQGFTVSFFGHRIVNDWDTVEVKLEHVIRHTIEHHNGVTFLVGRDGDFDHLVATTIRRLKQKTDRQDISLKWVMPYPKAEFVRDPDAFNMYYDEIEICEKSAAAHPRAAFTIRNQGMIDRSDLVIFYVEHSSGGAYQAYSYASSQAKDIINLA